MRWIQLMLLLLTLGVAAPANAEPGRPFLLAQNGKKKRKKRKKRRKKKKKNGEAKKKAEAEKAAAEKKAAEEAAKKAEKKEPTPEELEEKRVEAAKRKLAAEGRKKSKVTPGTASRWSNRGAMVPVPSTVPLTAPMPQRNVPIVTTVTTPGQGLLGGGQEEILSARLSFSGYHLGTAGQNVVFFDPAPTDDYSVATVVQDATRDMTFFRARATLGYDQIAGSNFAVRMDMEYRPRLTGTRLTDSRINELYVSYGLTDFRRNTDQWWGVALGRVTVREAGYAMADGLAARFRILDFLNAGVFGGLTTNPYVYNWQQRNTQLFSTDWFTGGGFISLQLPNLMANVAGVVTYNNVLPEAGMDRVHLYVDAAYLITPDLNVVVNGWIDLINPQDSYATNVDGVVSWRPMRELSLQAGGGHFATLGYVFTTEQVYVAQNNNIYDDGFGRIVGVDGNPVVPFDAVQMTTAYSHARLRGAYRIIDEVEVSARFRAMFRDASLHQDDLQVQVQNTVAPATVRMLPGLSARYRDPDIVDANVGFTYIIDDQSQADATIIAGVGRGLFGAYLGADVRYIVGNISALDTGVSLSYTFPRDWFPGALSIRGMFRYFQEDIDLEVPIADNEDRERELREGQKSIMGFGGLDWRL